MKKPRMKPKIFFRKKIRRSKTKYGKTYPIGIILLVHYLLGKDDIPHIEFFIEKEHRNKGIMSEEIKKYLKLCKKHEIFRLIALVKKDNIPSIRILEKNNFIRTIKRKDEFVYTIDLSFTRSQLKSAIELQKVFFNYHNDLSEIVLSK